MSPSRSSEEILEGERSDFWELVLGSWTMGWVDLL